MEENKKILEKLTIWNEIIKAARTLTLSALPIVGILLYGVNNPKLIAQYFEKEYVHSIVEDEVEHLPYVGSELRTKDSIFIAEEFEKIYKQLHNNDNYINENTLTGIKNKHAIDSNSRHSEFNTEVLSKHSEFMWEESDPPRNPSCSLIYRKSNSGDPYKILDEQYGCRVMYRLNLTNTDCRAYYTPIFGRETVIR